MELMHIIDAARRSVNATRGSPAHASADVTLAKLQRLLPSCVADRKRRVESHGDPRSVRSCDRHADDQSYFMPLCATTLDQRSASLRMNAANSAGVSVAG